MKYVVQLIHQCDDVKFRIDNLEDGMPKQDTDVLGPYR